MSTATQKKTEGTTLERGRELMRGGGPFSADELRVLIKAGQLLARDLEISEVDRRLISSAERAAVFFRDPEPEPEDDASIPSTPFDKKLAKARKELEAQKQAIEDARNQFHEYSGKIERLKDEVAGETRNLRPKERKRMEELKDLRDAAKQERREAIRLRRRAQARVSELEEARERYLVEEHGIFPKRRGTQARMTAEAMRQSEQDAPEPKETDG